MSKPHIDKLLSMANRAMTNYIVPGLESHLIGLGSANEGRVRIFANTRIQHGHITPHSHRFDFVAQVLQGSVTNTIYELTTQDEAKTAYEWVMSELEYNGEPGNYDIRQPGAVRFFSTQQRRYGAGDWYGMTHEQIHSIHFSQDAVVLFIEGPTLTNTSMILEPWVNDRKVPTFRVEDWMFQQKQQ